MPAAALSAEAHRARTGAPRRWLLQVLVLAALASLSTAGAQAFGDPSAAIGPRPPDLELGQVLPGQAGYALTAGAGGAIERFSVEVLGVQRDSGSGLDLVLIRAHGDIIEASGGVAAGMSGSPVYLQSPGGFGLLGAIAYVFANADHQLALVTPIDVMRAVADLDAAGDDPFASAATPAWPDAVTVPGIGEFEAVATPILISGADARTLGLVSELFATAAVTPLPMQAATTGASEAEEYELAPGAAIAVQLMRGDVDLSAIGTVTDVSEAGLLAFGHPFLGLGDVDMPLAPAFVTAIVASSVVPFKLANVGAGTLATLAQDRPAGLWARFDREPDLLPVTVTINAPGGSASYRIEVVNDERLYPNLVAIGVLRLVDRELQRVGGGSAAVAWRFALASGATVNVLEQLSDAGDVAFASALIAAEPFWILANNVFQAAGLASASLVIDLRDELDHATLEDVVIENETLTPGGHALLHLRLQPHRRPASVTTLSVPLPDDLGDVVTIVVRGGDVPLESDKLPDDPLEEDGGPRSFSELLDALREQYQASEIVVEAITPDGRVRRLLRHGTPQVVTGSFELELELESLAEPDQEDDDEVPGVPQGGGG